MISHDLMAVTELNLMQLECISILLHFATLFNICFCASNFAASEAHIVSKLCELVTKAEQQLVTEKFGDTSNPSISWPECWFLISDIPIIYSLTLPYQKQEF